VSQPTRATSEVFQLAEGPVWDAAGARLLWVDILAGAVLEGRLSAGLVEVAHRHDFPGMVSAVAVGQDAELLIAAQEQLVVLGPDGSRRHGPRVLPPDARRRLNDGSTDPSGRFLVGTLSLDGPSEDEVLVRLEPDGSLTEIDDDLTLSNGLAWSLDGRLMYSVDTLRRVVYVREYDVASGASSGRRVHVRLDDGHPDGIAVDAEGHLWVAVWGLGQVRRYAPDGALVDRLDVPAPHVSSVAFAEEDLRTLVITTATAELSDEQLRENPDSGALFTARVDVPGHATTAWAGLSRNSSPS